MSEFETDPQRRPADADRELSHPTAELPRDDRGQTAELARDDHAQTAELPRDDRGQSDAGTANPGTSFADPDTPGIGAATTDSGSTAPVASTGPAYGSPVPASGPAYGTPPPASGPAYGTPPPTSGPGYGSPPPTSGQPYGPGPYGAAQPYTLPPGGQPANPWQAPHGAPQHPHHGWAGHHPTGHPGLPGPGGGMPPQQPYGGPVPPPWATPANPGHAPGRLGKLVAVGATALALMVGSGIAGGAIALAVDDGGGVTKTYTAAPVINSADLPKIAAQVQNSVVSISTANAEGSGVVMSADGFILTNNHVVASATGNRVQVIFADGTQATAEIRGTDPKTDLAVIKAQGVSGLSAAKFGDSDAMQVGDTVLALGSPLGLQGSVTAGIISARERTIQAGGDEQGSPFNRPQQGVSSISGLLQTDAPINPGNSGGALINTNAEVIGINTAIATSGQGTGNIGVGFAIPSNKAKAVAEALQRGEKVSHPSLGVSVNPAENGGALVGGVVPGSAADKAGIQQGDVITQFGDKKINDSNDLVAAVQAGKVGDQVQVTYTRNGAQTTATVTLTEAS
ncbi:trypsin-like peptidase domain-containing protein [Plantactinospora sp. B5E13]|uniref:trypsin-like peptidase domain-containing protein n=1 Tax=unclassified Plantactinospora TaxID=2631981 RepID=UPI00325EB9A8